MGEIIDIAELFHGGAEGEQGLSFFRDRGLQHCSIQKESLLSMCTATVQESLSRSRLDATDIDAVILDADEWNCTSEERSQVLEALLATGITQVPLVGLSWQTCSGCVTALDHADRLLRTERSVQQVLVLICGRAMPGLSRLDYERGTILSDGVASCIVSAMGGDFRLCATSNRTVLRSLRAAAGQSVLTSLVRDYHHIVHVVSELYDAASIKSDDVEALLGTNGSHVYCAYSARAAGLSADRVFQVNVAAYGHVFSCDQLINLATFSSFRDSGYYLLMGWSPYVFNGALLSNVGSSVRS